MRRGRPGAPAPRRLVGCRQGKGAQVTELPPDPPRDPRHDPVLRAEVIAALAILPGERHVDATFGAGGYTRAMLAAGAEVVACDRDPAAIAEGQALVAEAGGKLTLVPGRFSSEERRVGEEGVSTCRYRW